MCSIQVYCHIRNAQHCADAYIPGLLGGPRCSLPAGGDALPCQGLRLGHSPRPRPSDML